MAPKALSARFLRTALGPSKFGLDVALILR